MFEWGLLVRIYGYLLINNKKLSISDEFMESIGSRIHSEKRCANFPFNAFDINKFISLFVYNLIIGNKDAHGKNYSILHRNNASVLAPAYDVLSTTYYPELSEKMSMSINGKFELDEITEDDLYQMAQSSNISGKLVLKEYHRIKDGLLPQATKVLSETAFSDTFRTAFFEHFEKVHAQLPF
jgi:hypothetical protein